MFVRLGIYKTNLFRAMFEQMYVYTIIKRDNSILAVPSGFNGAITFEVNALYEQGYIFCCEITAPNPNRAVEIYIENEKLEINRLRKELARVQAAYNEVFRENNNLKRNSSLWTHEASSSVKYFELFGFSEFPQPEELKKRFKSVRQKLHPDKGGDKQLFQLFEQAYKELTKT